MLRKISDTIRKHGLLKSGQSVLLGVSGGADSVALTHALHRLQKRWNLTLTLAHLNHGLRGRSADADEKFVRELGAQLGLDCKAEKADVRRLMRDKGLSLEMAARQARYDFFARTAQEVGADALATAHTADDQAETILLKLARGAGPQGLSGIPIVGQWGALPVIRPMREVFHREALAFLRGQGLKWREDRSNKDLSILRNRVRHEILPLLETRLNPQLRSVLIRTGDVLAAENAWMDSWARRSLTRCRDSKNRTHLLAGSLRKMPLAARRRVIRLWLAESGVDMDAVDFELVDRIDSLSRSSMGMRSVPLGSSGRVICKYGELEVTRQAVHAPIIFSADLKVPGETVVKAAGLRVIARWGNGIVRSKPARVGETPAEVTIDARAARRAQFTLSSWQAGDRIRPLGMTGTVKLQDLFTDQKIPRSDRWRVPVLKCGKEVVWVAGYRIARGWEVPGEKAASLHLRIELVHTGVVKNSKKARK